MKSKYPKGEAYNLEDVINSDFKRCVDQYGEEKIFLIYDKMLKREYLSSFKGVNPVTVKRALNRVIGKPFLAELDIDWKRRADEGLSEEDILAEMKSDGYLETSLGDKIPKDVKQIFEKVLSSYINVREEWLANKAKEADKENKESKEDIEDIVTKLDAKDKMEQKEMKSKTVGATKTKKEVKSAETNKPKKEEVKEIVEDKKAVKANANEEENTLPNSEEQIENDQKETKKGILKIRKLEIDQDMSEKWGTGDIEFYRSVWAITRGFKSLTTPPYMYDRIYGARRDAKFKNIKQADRFSKIQEMVTR